jgi:anthranilate synthase component 1
VAKNNLLGEHMDFETFKQYSEDYSAIPVYRRLMADTLTPVSLFLSLREGAKYPFLLESVEGSEQIARYSFIGRDPYQVLRYQDGGVTLQIDGAPDQALKQDYFSALRQLTTAYKEPDIPELPRLTGGAVGFSSYDTVRDIEALPDQPEDALHLPDAIWAFYDEVFAFDHVKQQVIIIKTLFPGQVDDPREKQFKQAQHRLGELQEMIFYQPKRNGTFSLNPDALKSNFSRTDFEESIEKAKEYIFEGDIFQVVLSQRFETDFSGDRFMLYRALRMVNPSPYLFFLDFDEMALVGSSPEVLVRVQGDKASLLPIAGTRPRGQTPEEDDALERELKNDPKEIAEHVMLVDLGRNDLSRVCRPGTVAPVRHQEVVRFSHVMHIISEVSGQLSPGKTAVDVLKGTFPAGTVSGAPKVRAMEIIDELEPAKRGPYAGGVGYFDFSGNMDTCIAIRTMVVTEGNIYIQAGAGMVADSDPHTEFIETKNKAAALVEALSVALEIEH